MDGGPGSQMLGQHHSQLSPGEYIMGHGSQTPDSSNGHSKQLGGGGGGSNSGPSSDKPIKTLNRVPRMYIRLKSCI